MKGGGAVDSCRPDGPLGVKGIAPLGVNGIAPPSLGVNGATPPSLGVNGAAGGLGLNGCTAGGCGCFGINRCGWVPGVNGWAPAGAAIGAPIGCAGPLGVKGCDPPTMGVKG
mmetsp:Transcript_17625/g.40952  ORF Transcript_17625/g.40952 Transcript_17625/m.40952 type:complete len:112 (+) Transcript_17625:571-906(+)